MSGNHNIGEAQVITHPSLALTKYWGKMDSRLNLPATPSLAVGLDSLTCQTHVKVQAKGSHMITVNGNVQNISRYQPFLDELIAISGGRSFFIQANSQTNFPVNAGIASSSAGFAALALACCRALKLNLNDKETSQLARIGSASAARAVFGGFTLLPEGGYSAIPLFGDMDTDYWPQLRIAVIEIQSEPKKISSREAMKHCQASSPYYDKWLSDAKELTDQALSALENRRLDRLGPLIRQSYLAMFAVMMSSRPPVMYWAANTVRVLHLLESLRNEGLEVWETMDAGPQVKVFCLEPDCIPLIERLKITVPSTRITICRVAPPPRIIK